ncbi:hypothetical protein AVANI_33 [Mycobacterium phage Avani]|uniref:Uncharacterized protein n=2 Tax=Avanivirus TaxID=2843352 RepID=Q855T0_9CAUD|nr:hypothetical protein PBI_CHE9D_33 [Mycobacterium phage Che9d]YP_009013128.1 hypothetical protein CL78_gp033 [Mycobacterium phage Avani]AAN07951.1 hypothetical protein PBI_CHE9D_33 [Mycobacterium phage Che9d]AFL47947.1 hypothetical protein AVANI_33 [Mycobacterium phage Avani]
MPDLETRVARLEKQLLALIAQHEQHTHKYGTSVVNCREVELRTERP